MCSDINTEVVKNLANIKRLENEVELHKKSIDELKDCNEQLRQRILELETQPKSITQRVLELEHNAQIQALESEKRQARLVIGEIAYAVEQNVIAFVFAGRESGEICRMKFSDMFNQRIEKSAEEQQRIAELAAQFSMTQQSLSYLSRGLKQLKNLGLHDAHLTPKVKETLSMENIETLFESQFNSYSGESSKSSEKLKYEKEDADKIFKYFMLTAKDKAFPLNK